MNKIQPEMNIEIEKFSPVRSEILNVIRIYYNNFLNKMYRHVTEHLLVGAFLSYSEGCI